MGMFTNKHNDMTNQSGFEIHPEHPPPLDCPFSEDVLQTLRIAAKIMIITDAISIIIPMISAGVRYD